MIAINFYTVPGKDKAPAFLGGVNTVVLLKFTGNGMVIIRSSGNIGRIFVVFFIFVSGLFTYPVVVLGVVILGRLRLPGLSTTTGGILL